MMILFIAQQKLCKLTLVRLIDVKNFVSHLLLYLFISGHDEMLFEINSPNNFFQDE